ncbi:MAG: hypothetical protein U1A27_08020 [Phycisphaerae bacterium]
MSSGMLVRRRWMVGAALAAAIVPAGAVYAAESAAAHVLSLRSGAIVTVKFLLKLKAGAQEQEIDAEISGVMIDAKGLVVCSDTQMGGFAARARRSGGNFTATPTEIKILAGDDNEGVPARVVARDSELDLAWVEVKKPPAKPFDAIDLNLAGTPKVGDTLVALRRMDKQFDRVVVVSEGWLAGTVRKPRELLVPGGTIGTALGLPIFTADGAPVGLIITQAPDDDDESGSDRIARAFGLRQQSPPLILPAAEVLNATHRARESATTRKADEDDSAESPAAPAKPSRAKPDESGKSGDTKPGDAKHGDVKPVEKPKG